MRICETCNASEKDKLFRSYRNNLCAECLSEKNKKYRVKHYINVQKPAREKKRIVSREVKREYKLKSVMEYLGRG
jgi:hypothetical protein